MTAKPYTPEYTLFGILNADGQFWTHKVFFTLDGARAYIAEFWRGHDKRFLDGYRVVRVRITLEELPLGSADRCSSRAAAHLSDEPPQPQVGAGSGEGNT